MQINFFQKKWLEKEKTKGYESCHSLNTSKSQTFIKNIHYLFKVYFKVWMLAFVNKIVKNMKNLHLLQIARKTEDFLNVALGKYKTKLKPVN